MTDDDGTEDSSGQVTYAEVSISAPQSLPVELADNDIGGILSHYGVTDDGTAIA